MLNTLPLAFDCLSPYLARRNGIRFFGFRRRLQAFVQLWVCLFEDEAALFFAEATKPKQRVETDFVAGARRDNFEIE